MLTAAAEYYDSATITVEDATDPQFQAWLAELIGASGHSGGSRAFSAEEFALYGQAAGDGGQFVESVLLQNTQGILTRWAEPPIVLYPKFTSWFDFPFAIWAGPETSAAQKDAALAFQRFLLSGAQQQRALSYGVRPANPDVALAATEDSLFVRWEKLGVRDEIPRTQVMLPPSRGRFVGPPALVRRECSPMTDPSPAANGGRAQPPASIWQQIPPGRQLLAIGICAILLFGACSTATVRIGSWIADLALSQAQSAAGDGNTARSTWPADSAELTVAVSPSMAETLQERADAFNRSRQRTPDSQAMRVALVTMSPQEMVERSLRRPGFQAVAPDSSLWLRRIDRRWAELFPPQPGSLPERRVGEPTYFALSPIVIAMRTEEARQLGWPGNTVGWKELHTRALSDAEFRLQHPDVDSTAGLLATLAAFYVGAGTDHALTHELATRADVLDYVRKVEATVDASGAPDESTGAIVAQEQQVIAWNRAGNRSPAHGPWVAVYPHEGTLWADHPLALLALNGRDGPALTLNQRRTYRAFTQFLLEEESQLELRQYGYRPADLNLYLQAELSPFANNAAVDTRQPQSLLPSPPTPLVEIVLKVWRYTKRPANLYLVVDTSESMEGRKLRSTKAALHAFVAQIEGDRDRIGLVEFGSEAKHFGSLNYLDSEGRSLLTQEIESMTAGGYTALLDAVLTAHAALQSVGDTASINAIVVMTDGRDNDSQKRLRDLKRAMDDAQVPVAIYAVAFGRDADNALLEELAGIGVGQVHFADETNIEELYRHIATYLRTPKR